MKNILSLSFFILITTNVFATKCDHHDDYEIRYITENMQLKLIKFKKIYVIKYRGKNFYQIIQIGLPILMNIIINLTEHLVHQ